MVVYWYSDDVVPWSSYVNFCVVVLSLVHLEDEADKMVF